MREYINQHDIMTVTFFLHPVTQHVIIEFILSNLTLRR